MQLKSNYTRQLNFVIIIYELITTLDMLIKIFKHAVKSNHPHIFTNILLHFIIYTFFFIQKTNLYFWLLNKLQ